MPWYPRERVNPTRVAHPNRVFLKNFDEERFYFQVRIKDILCVKCSDNYATMASNGIHSRFKEVSPEERAEIREKFEDVSCWKKWAG